MKKSGTKIKRRVIKAKWNNVLAMIMVFLLLCTVQLPEVVIASSGDLDPTFGSGGKVVSDISAGLDFALAVTIQPDGRILAGGFATSSVTSRDFALVRYNPNGSLDPTFGSAGVLISPFSASVDQISALVLLADGKIVCAGSIYTPDRDYDFLLARFHPNGSLDTTFGVGGSVTVDFENRSDTAYGLALQSDGKLVVVGTTQNFDTFTDDFAVARFNGNGTLDTSFGVAGRVTTDFNGDLDIARDIVIQPNGQMVVAGTAALKGSAQFGLSRYNSDGTLDSTFGLGGKVSTEFGGTSAPYALVLRTDGKLLAAGEAWNPTAGNPDFAMARYNNDGSLDTTLGGDGTVTTDFVNTQDIATSVAIQSNGNILLAGESQPIPGADSRFALASYTPEGEPDSAFGNNGRVITTFGTFAASIGAISIQSDAKIVAVGSALEGFGIGEFALARYQACGLSFVPQGAFFPTGGGDGILNIVSPNGCKWSAVCIANWITITSDQSGNGNGVVTFAVRENFTHSARQADIRVVGLDFTVTQDGGLGDDCEYFISPSSVSFSAAGGSSAAQVFASTRCAWQATPNRGWITINSGGIGVGNGTITYTVGVNPGPSGRAGTITVGGRTLAIKQKAPGF